MEKKNNDVNVHLVQYSNNIYRPIAKYIVKYLSETRITPNQISLASLMIGILSAVLFSFNHRGVMFVAIVVLHLSILLDFVDGGVARQKGMTSIRGAWLDSIFDRLIDPLLFLGISCGIYLSSGKPLTWLLCAITILSRLFVDILYFITRIEIGLDYVTKEVKRGWFVRLFLYGRTNIHILTTLAVIFNQMTLYLVLVCLYSFSFALYSFAYINHNIQNRHGKEI